MKLVFLLIIALSLFSCDGSGLPGAASVDSGDEAPKCSPVLFTKDAEGCTWQLPAGLRCSGYVVRVGDKIVTADALNFVCSAGALVLAPNECIAVADGASLSIEQCD